MKTDRRKGGRKCFTPFGVFENLMVLFRKNKKCRKASPVGFQTPFQFATGHAGFTLIELLVTTAVMMIIMGSVAGTGISRRTQFTLSINQEKLRTLVSRAKGLTLNSLIDQGSNICGYGVHVERTRAFIFTDRSSNCSASDRVYTSSAEELVGGANEVQAEGGVFFYDMSLPPSNSVNPPNFGGGHGGRIDVLFVPPDPTTYINGVQGGSTMIGIASSSSDWRKVVVEGSGLISARSY